MAKLVDAQDFRKKNLYTLKSINLRVVSAQGETFDVEAG